MVNRTVSYSTWQSNPSLSFIGRRVITGAILAFPIGAKYEVRVESSVDNYGAGTIAYVRVGSSNGSIILKFDSNKDEVDVKKSSPPFIIDTRLAANNIWQSQNSGTNASMDHIITYRKIASPIVPTVTLQELKHGKN